MNKIRGASIFAPLNHRQGVLSHRSVTTVTTHLLTNDYNAIVDCADEIKMKDTRELHLLSLQNKRLFVSEHHFSRKPYYFFFFLLYLVIPEIFFTSVLSISKIYKLRSFLYGDIFESPGQSCRLAVTSVAWQWCQSVDSVDSGCGGDRVDM